MPSFSSDRSNLTAGHRATSIGTERAGGVPVLDAAQLDADVTVAMFKAAAAVKDNPVTRDVPSGKLHEFLMEFARAYGVNVPGEPQQ